MRAQFSLTIITCLIFTAGAAQNAYAQDENADQDAEAQELMRLSQAWADSLAAGNLEATFDFWTDDAVIMVPGQPLIRGKAAIREFVMASESIPGFEITWEPMEAHVSDSGDLAYLIERNRVTAPDSTGDLVTGYNKGVTIWERQPDGSWKNVVDIWNADPTAWE